MSVSMIEAEVSPSCTWPTGWCSVLTHTHTYSGKSDHGGTVRPPESYRQLAAWARRCRIDALAMGSPYTAKSAVSYMRYDGDEREDYYSDTFDKHALMHTDEIEAMLGEMAHYAEGRTLFYLDNETPKGRYGHMWWLGHQPDYPAWHDYDQPYDRWMFEANAPGDFSDEPVAYERRPYLEVLAAQRARGALGFWAHPTSWWCSDRGQFITNIASEMPAHVIAEGFIDGMVIMGYHPYRPQYLALWFALLDRGYRISGVAEMDVGLSDAKLWQNNNPMLTHVLRPGGGLSVTGLVNAFRTGCLFSSSGPFISLTVDRQDMGGVARTSPQATHTVQIAAYPGPGKPPLGRLELLGPGGRVLWQQEDFPGGTVELQIPGLAQRGYLVARVFGAQDDPARWHDVRQFAITNPVYLHPAGEIFNRPATTEVQLTIRPDSEFLGGQVQFEAMDGSLLGLAVARGTVCESLPAAGRITLISPEKRRQTSYLVNANQALQTTQRYLYRGRFLQDYPSLQPGELPPEAWRLDHYQDAMRRVELTY